MEIYIFFTTELHALAMLLLVGIGAQAQTNRTECYPLMQSVG